MSADILRRAANLLRLTNDGLPAGPWWFAPGDSRPAWTLHVGATPYAEVSNGSEQENFPTLLCALLAAAEPLATWLDDTATDVEAAPVPDDDCLCYHKAVDTARAILWEEQS